MNCGSTGSKAVITDADLRYAQAWAATMSVNQWWLTASASLRSDGWHSLQIIWPGKGTIYTIECDDTRLVAREPGQGRGHRFQTFRAALAAFRRPGARDIASIGDLVFACDGAPAQFSDRSKLALVGSKTHAVGRDWNGQEPARAVIPATV